MNRVAGFQKTKIGNKIFLTVGIKSGRQQRPTSKRLGYFDCLGLLNDLFINLYIYVFVIILTTVLLIPTAVHSVRLWNN